MFTQRRRRRAKIVLPPLLVAVGLMGVVATTGGGSALAVAPAAPEPGVGALLADATASGSPERIDVLGIPAVPERLSVGANDLPETRDVERIAEGVTLTTVRRGKDAGSSANGPWVIRALTIDPTKADGQLDVALGSTLGQQLRTSELTRRTDALAGINASFFSPGTSEPGDPFGLTIADGAVLSEPSGFRSEVTVLIDSERNTIRLASVKWSGVLRHLGNGETLEVQRVNSAPDNRFGCTETTTVARCATSGQVSVITRKFGRETPSGPGAEVVLDPAGCVVSVSKHRGTHLAEGQIAVQATGSMASRLRELTGEDGCLQVEHTLRDGAGKPVELTSSLSAVTGRIRLLRAGDIAAPDRDKYLFRRHPRTIVGSTWDGKIMMVTIDGRERTSVGATLRESAEIVQGLGMRDAVNLDGGGSATLAVRHKKVNRTGASERPVGDAIVWRPRDRG